jgi:peptidoglycan/LPS O-acetylase OafA/YrhL
MSRLSHFKSVALSRLSRVTTPGRKFVPQIDGLRFIAIMSVIAYHVSLSYLFHRGYTNATQPVPKFLVNTIFAAGHNGVPLFFAISGFILSLPFARQALTGAPAVNLREYYIRRLTRIEPPYVIQLLVMLALCVLVFRRLPSHAKLYHNPDWFRFALSHIGASLIYMNGLIFGDHPYPNFVLWSLEVEVQFYLLAPLLARLFLIRDHARRRACLITLFLLGITLTSLFGNHYRVWTSLLGNIQFFMIGFFFADVHAVGRLANSPGERKWDLAFLLAGALVVCGENGTATFTLPVAIIVCFLAAFRGILAVRFLRNPWIVTVGGMCYTIYLYHVVLISIAVKVSEKVRLSNPSADLLLQFVLLLAAIIPISALLFMILERPFMDRRWPAKLREAISGAPPEARKQSGRDEEIAQPN